MCDASGYCTQESDLLPCTDLLCDCKHRNSAEMMLAAMREKAKKDSKTSTSTEEQT